MRSSQNPARSVPRHRSASRSRQRRGRERQSDTAILSSLAPDFPPTNYDDDDDDDEKRDHHHRHRAKKRTRRKRDRRRKARTISSGDSTPNCTVFTRFSSAVECGKRSKTLMMFTTSDDDYAREENAFFFFFFFFFLFLFLLFALVDPPKKRTTKMTTTTTRRLKAREGEGERIWQKKGEEKGASRKSKERLPPFSLNCTSLNPITIETLNPGHFFSENKKKIHFFGRRKKRDRSHRLALAGGRSPRWRFTEETLTKRRRRRRRGIFREV